MANFTAATLPARQLYRVAEAMVVLSLSRSVIYELIRSGRLRSVTEGRTRLIPAAAIADYIALLTIESEGADYGKPA
ncbi:helix-turn-helix domain-containing protein [Pseudonocardia sp. D17]|uniref:helix-turn-helix domain-containing protein n=1 Tax=Pseudonocardia sp. D17 TaxID=882661 RepID=UPI002B38B5AE|nr:excisionase [Pseudonocardia sp. D17]